MTPSTTKDPTGRPGVRAILADIRDQAAQLDQLAEEAAIAAAADQLELTYRSLARTPARDLAEIELKLAELCERLRGELTDAQLTEHHAELTDYLLAEGARDDLRRRGGA